MGYKNSSCTDKAGNDINSQLVNEKNMEEQNKEYKKHKRKRRGIEKNKIRYIRVRCTDSDYQKLIKKSKNFGSLSACLRMMIFDSRKNIIDPKSLLNIINVLSPEISRVGNNINQIAKYMNSAMKSGVVDIEIIARSEEPIKEFVYILDKLKQELYNLHNLD